MTLAAVLLTGGESRRMGADKATLDWSGEPLWSRQLRLLRSLQPNPLWISARARPPWSPPGVETILDVPPSRGPLSGLSAALDRLTATHLLALAVDLPHLTAAHLRHIVHLTTPGCGIIPFHRARFEPLCAIYPVQAAPAARAALSRGELSLQSLAQTLAAAGQLQIYSVPESEQPLYRNLNSPSDL